MRLICPNCGAQYDVPTEVIPDGGRDVQCSNCGHTWFQSHPDQDEALAEELDQPRAVSPKRTERPTSDPLPEATRPTATDPLPEAAPPRRIDPEMAELFREERDYEARQRRAESLETQPDLGLEAHRENEQAHRSRQARERMSRLRADQDDGPRAAPRRGATPAESAPPSETRPAAAAAAGSRRDLLPDVDEINQSLRAESEPRMIDAAERSQAPAEPEQGGFGKGFLLVVALAALAIGTYAFAPDLSQQLPQAAPYLESYVASVDQGRVWLDGQVKTLLQMLDGMSSEAAQPDAEAPDAAPEADQPADDGS